LKIIIVGAGEVGYNIAKRLASENKHVIVIDQNHDACRRML
jgi:trk system potassium uptake protein TrkA